MNSSKKGKPKVKKFEKLNGAGTVYGPEMCSHCNREYRIKPWDTILAGKVNYYCSGECLHQFLEARYASQSVIQ